MNIFLANVDNPDAKSLMIKLSGKKTDGQIVQLTKEENQAFHSDDFTWLNMGAQDSNKPLDIVKLDQDGKYVFVCQPQNVVIDDITMTGEALGLDYSIVRVK